jgi:hypothetical protein
MRVVDDHRQSDKGYCGAAAAEIEVEVFELGAPARRECRGFRSFAASGWLI